MEHLIINLKQNLIARRQKEVLLIEEMDKEADKELILISAGKINELDFVVESLNDLLIYSEKTKKTVK